MKLYTMICGPLTSHYLLNSKHELCVIHYIMYISCSVSRFHPSTVPRHSYVTSVPVPAPRKVVQPSTPISVKPRDFDDLRSTYLARINDMFDTLGEKFNQLDKYVRLYSGTSLIRTLLGQIEVS